jgi:hypothetical protein
MESLTLSVIKAVRERLFKSGDFTEVEYNIVTKVLDIIIEEVERADGPQPASSSKVSAKSRKVSGH